MMKRSSTTQLLAMAMATQLVGCMSSGQKNLIEPTQPPVHISATANPTSTLWETSLKDPLTEAKEELSEDKLNSAPLAKELNLAQIALAQNKIEDANKHARRALTFDIKNDKARMIMAHSYYRRNLIDLAEIALGGLSKGASKRPEVYNLQALIALSRKNPPEALSNFKKGLALDATNSAIRMNLGILYLSYRQIRSAARQFERILKDYPKHNDAKFHLAVARAAMGETEYSRAVYEEVADAIDSHPFAIFNIALLDADNEKYKDAIDGLKQYLSTDIAKSSNNSEIFALISEFENMNAAMAKGPSDEEIQKMAAKAGPPETTKSANSSDAAFGFPEDNEATPVNSQVSEPEQPKVKRASPQKSKTKSPKDADLEMLEKELQR